MSRPYWTLERIFSVLPEKRVAEIFRKSKESVIDQSAGSADMIRISAAGDRADDMIDAYLRGHYAVPLDVVPSEIAEASAIKTVQNLLIQSESTALDEKYAGIFKQNESFLTAVRDDKIRLAVEAGQAGSETRHQGNDIVRFVSSDRMFGDDTLAKF